MTVFFQKLLQLNVSCITGPQLEIGGTTKRDVEKVRGARDEGSRVKLGPGRKAGSGQTTMAFHGVGIVCKHVRRGLSK